MTQHPDVVDLHALAGELLDRARTEHEDSVVLLSIAVAQRAPS